MRQGTAIPYVAHLLVVAEFRDEPIVALLHNAVEDQEDATGSTISGHGSARVKTRTDAGVWDAIYAL